MDLSGPVYILSEYSLDILWIFSEYALGGLIYCRFFKIGIEFAVKFKMMRAKYMRRFEM